MCTKCSKQVLWAFDKSLAGKKMSSGTRLGTADLENENVSGCLMIDEKQNYITNLIQLLKRSALNPFLAICSSSRMQKENRKLLCLSLED